MIASFETGVGILTTVGSCNKNKRVFTKKQWFCEKHIFVIIKNAYSYGIIMFCKNYKPTSNPQQRQQHKNCPRQPCVNSFPFVRARPEGMGNQGGRKLRMLHYCVTERQDPQHQAPRPEQVGGCPGSLGKLFNYAETRACSPVVDQLGKGSSTFIDHQFSHPVRSTLADYATITSHTPTYFPTSKLDFSTSRFQQFHPQRYIPRPTPQR